MKIKIGFDVHGVIDKDPNFFATLIYHLRTEGHEVHIITGRELDDYIYDKLKCFNINFDKIFSITSYHKRIGTHITYKNEDPTQPLIAPSKWDRTKADYAERHGLDLHIDDSKTYGHYFTGNTQYVLYTPAMRTLLWLMLGWSTKLEDLPYDGP